jgi:2-polyprenyl-6-methoxyphenol hydroxylase-like FAD-dependent oxidoreductase
MNAQKICIIGDGLAGLSAAAILSQENIKIDLYSENIRKNKLKRDNRTTAISESNFQFIKQKLDIKKNNIFWACKEINLFYEKKNTIKNFLNFKEKKKILMYIFKNYQLKKILSEAIVKKKILKL